MVARARQTATAMATARPARTRLALGVGFAAWSLSWRDFAVSVRERFAAGESAVDSCGVRGDRGEWEQEGGVYVDIAEGAGEGGGGGAVRCDNTSWWFFVLFSSFAQFFGGDLKSNFKGVEH